MTGSWIDDTNRRDGLQVMLGTVGWCIRPSNSRTVLHLCPCCERPFRTCIAARKAADKEFPLADGDNVVAIERGTPAQ